MIHNGNKKHSATNALLNVATVVSALVMTFSAFCTIYSGLNLAFNIKIPGTPQTSMGLFLAFVLTFTAGSLSLISAAVANRLSQPFVLTQETSRNTSQQNTSEDDQHRLRSTSQQNTSEDDQHRLRNTSQQNTSEDDDQHRLRNTSELDGQDNNSPPSSVVRQSTMQGIPSAQQEV
ncbi:hypothetical protein ECHHL_0464 [Ehrlichia chaffeensis str. Heartland]|uniref:Uncharacterized protein n=1 Tax=Ehrlichia chaffeensis (strain ATCC CRL-10679 / Arkansas) TaxID=205920 RepID=Q2GGT8_EHRCR|nr:hypothetical protein [Ehrlichia chaffeensis]ABD45218.1 hypothetical protein ECH_0531 [Ehrlichia chaffeensis str. Arkansas]AHX03625.1 hypothetical protein ECHHL_0464 [Ehrlichia chaffeensis str. Heartland]AHX05654.1 hypothetical protein ECHJAX_0593 [Ehrlichia chaffeensis str. Jax]AHX06645.1 hypothetical protein ECHLIB_0595 [Ehrlichia chaffeensis str. Liberty]AHX07111.1 hypothetical protein ECHOSC_0471 [Ehrlichia chaffeensis str. Osceola]